MMAREEVIEVEQYCSEHKVSKKARLMELGIPFWNFYKARQKYQREDVMGNEKYIIFGNNDTA